MAQKINPEILYQPDLPVISFSSVGLPFGWLGNMAAFPILFEGRTWRTSEALFQALRFSDPGIREMIRCEVSPISAKMKANAIINRHLRVVEPRSPDDVENMRRCLQLKFTQHPALADQLLETGLREILEDIGRRNGQRHFFWGAKKMNGVWVGTNNMGRLLMEHRANLRASNSMTA